MRPPAKILVVQSKYFGDAALMVPALRALREHWASAQIHLLIPVAIAPLLEHLPWINKVWAIARERGKAAPGTTWPVLRALRRELFDCAVDIGGNDRGAILTRISGARDRLGILKPGGFFGRRLCFTRMRALPTHAIHESARLVDLLQAWGVPPPGSMELELRSDPALADFARGLVPERPVICHLSTGMLKKEWPVAAWAELARLSTDAGIEMLFSSGVSARERELLADLKRLAPTAQPLPALPDIRQFLAVLHRARVFVSGDTGPLHFAAGLGVATVALYGPSSVAQWAPIGARHRLIQGTACTCPGAQGHCSNHTPCMMGISPLAVLKLLQTTLATA